MAHLSKTVTVAAVATAASVLLAGCEKGIVDPDVVAPTATRACPPNGEVSLPLPAGFPESSPSARRVPVVSTEVVEHALLRADTHQEHATVVHRVVQFGHGTRDWGVEQVLGFYRSALPEAGWVITREEPLGPGRLLQVEGPDQPDVTIRIEREQGAVISEVSIVQVDHDHRASTAPPLVAMPSWYRTLPPPPEGVRRNRIRISASIGQPTRYMIEYEDRGVDDHPYDRAVTLAEHYRHRLPAGEWTIYDERDYSERRPQEGGVIERRHVVIEFAGHQVTGTVHASQAVSAAGRWLWSTLAINIDDARPKPATAGPAASHDSPAP